MMLSRLSAKGVEAVEKKRGGWGLTITISTKKTKIGSSFNSNRAKRQR
jgi:hypothetical protein